MDELDRDVLDRTVRRARWWEYPGLARLVALRLAQSRDPDHPPGGPLRRAGLWLTAWVTMVVYGAWTTEHRQAVAHDIAARYSPLGAD